MPQKLMVSINPEALEKAITDSGYSRTVISRALGKADQYFGTVMTRGVIPREVANDLERIFDIKTKSYELKKESSQAPDEPAASAAIDYSALGKAVADSIDYEAIRGAVYNGMMDSLLMMFKDDTIYKMIMRILQDEEMINALQKPIFLGINGARKLKECEGTDQRPAGYGQNKILPQNGVRR